MDHPDVPTSAVTAVTTHAPQASLSDTAAPRTAHRILVVDDHVALRACLRSLLECYPELSVVGEAGDGVEAVALTGSLRPDFVLMDVRLPRLNGIEATRRIRSLNPAPVVIGLTVHWTPALEAAMSRAGASACLAKADAAERLRDVILAAQPGRPVEPC